jgi:TetR/AcrR family transcriptional regulator
MAIMKNKKALEQADYDAAKATIAQLVMGGLGLAPAHAPAAPPARAKAAKRPRA